MSLRKPFAVLPVVALSSLVLGYEELSWASKQPVPERILSGIHGRDIYHKPKNDDCTYYTPLSGGQVTFDNCPSTGDPPCIKCLVGQFMGATYTTDGTGTVQALAPNACNTLTRKLGTCNG